MRERVGVKLGDDAHSCVEQECLAGFSTGEASIYFRPYALTINTDVLIEKCARIRPKHKHGLTVLSQASH
jgi:hypothetical protein